MIIKEAEQLARDLMNKHQLFWWRLEFDYAVKRFGYCTKGKKLISLSKPLTELNSKEKVEQIILHEIAHALTTKGKSHGKEWKRIAKSIGYGGKRCYDETVITPLSKYTATCPNGHTHQAMRRAKVSCSKCCPIFNEKYLFKFTLN